MRGLGRTSGFINEKSPTTAALKTTNHFHIPEGIRAIGGLGIRHSVKSNLVSKLRNKGFGTKGSKGL